MSRKNQLMLAIDGGASKTDVVLFTPDGSVLSRVLGGSTNPNDIGFDRAVHNLNILFESVLSEYEGSRTPLLSVFGGFSGGTVGNNRKRYGEMLKQLLPAAQNVENSSDAISALTSGIGRDNGMVLVAGTGAVVFIREDDTISQVGGWGYLLGDEGSAYDLGRGGFNRALRAIDGRGEMTALVELYAEAIGMPIVQAIPEIYQKGKKYIASFAPLVFKAAADGDETAIALVQSCAEELSQLLRAGCRNMQKPPFRVVIVGSMWKSGGILEERLESQLDPQFELCITALPPVYGSALEALYLIDREAGQPFKDNFKASLGEGLII